MIDDIVRDERERFIKWWEPHLAVSPHLALDGSWPSVGVLDLLTFHLRLRTPSDWSHSAILRGAAAYLAYMAHDCWEAFGATPEVTMGSTGVIMTARSGPRLGSGQRVVVHVERELKKLIRFLPAPFPVLGEFSRLIAIDQNIVSLFAIGLCTGLTPVAEEGPWLDETPESFKEQIRLVTVKLAASSAERYGTLFPDETLGQVGELYLEQLIYPPALMEEELPALNAVNGMIAFFHEFRVPREAQFRLAGNLALSADEQISAAGFSVYAALLDAAPAVEMQGLVQSRLRSNGLYRNAMILARTGLGLDGDWIGRENYTEAIGRRFELERQLGYLPWVSISKRKLKESFSNLNFHSAIAAAADFDRDSAIDYTDRYLDEAPGDLDMRLQRIYLEAIAPDSKDRVLQMLRALSSEPDIDRQVRFNEMMSTALFAQEDFEGARRHLKLALECAQSQPFVRAELLNNLGWMQMQIGELEESLRNFDTALATQPHSITYLLNKGHALWQMGRNAEMEGVIAKLFELAPMHRSVFSILISREAVRRLGKSGKGRQGAESSGTRAGE